MEIPRTSGAIFRPVFSYCSALSEWAQMLYRIQATAGWPNYTIKTLATPPLLAVEQGTYIDHSSLLAGEADALLHSG